MNEAQILDVITAVLEKNFHVKKEDVKMTALLDDDLGLDSVDTMDSVYYLEEVLKVKMLDEGPDANFNVKSIEDVVRHVQQRLEKQQ